MEKSEDYSLETYRPADKNRFLAAFPQEAKGSDPEVIARRLWWAFDNPSGGAFFLVRSGSAVAATSYLGGKRINVAGKILSGFEIGETATDPAHQRRGLFSKLVTASKLHATELGQPEIYGTPNSQSTPGYAKLGFEIIKSDASWLFLIPNIRYALPLPTMPRSCVELGAKDYIAETMAFPRLNVTSDQYLHWRLVEAPVRYRFFSMITNGSTWHLAMRFGMLGKYPTLICSECFRNGERADLLESAKVIKSVASSKIPPRSYAAVQIHNVMPANLSYMALRLRGIIPHRILPICTLEIDHNASAWFRHFQLSDCDIG